MKKAVLPMDFFWALSPAKKALLQSQLSIPNGDGANLIRNPLYNIIQTIRHTFSEPK